MRSTLTPVETSTIGANRSSVKSNAEIRVGIGDVKVLDRDDERVIKEAKASGAVLVTQDRVLRLAAGGMTAHEMLVMGMREGKGTPEALANVSRLHKLTPRELTVMGEAGNQTYKYFQKHINVNMATAKLIRKLRVEKDLSWRAVARFCSKLWTAPWGGNQIAGMVICDKAAKLLGEDFMQPPWN